MARRIPSAVPFLVLSLFLALPAGAADLLFDDFGTYPPGPIAALDNVSPWHAGGYALTDLANNVYVNPLYPQVVDNVSYLQLSGNHQACQVAEASRPVALPPGDGEFFVRLDIRGSREIDNTWQNVCPENRYDVRASLRAAAGAPGSGVTLIEAAAGGATNLDNVFLNPYSFNNVLVRVNRVDAVKEYWVNGAWRGAYDAADLLTLGDSLDTVSLLGGGGKGSFDRVRVFTDTTPPTTTANLSGTAGTNGWYRSSVYTTLSSNEQNHSYSTGTGTRYTQYRLNGGAWTTSPLSFYATAQGTTTIEYQSVDLAGNAEAVKTTTLKIDTIAPTSTPSIVPADGATGVATTVAPTATYGENVYPGTAYSSVELYNTKTKTKVSAAVSITGAVLKITPSSALASRTKYRVTIPAQGVQDVAGNGQAAAKAWYFTTK